MAYSEQEARELVIKAGLELVEKELIARTWGNISARISDSQFIITPSGRAYEDLKPEDLVKVNISDLSYEGDVKPSSEKGIHAACYSLRPEVNFVIHTHQIFASAISVCQKSYDFAPLAGYGLPGTKKLWSKVSEAVKSNPQSKAFLMQAHGALCVGKDYDEAFEVSLKLEEDSKAKYNEIKVEVSEKRKLKPFIDDFAQIMGRKGCPMVGEDAKAVQLICYKNAIAASCKGAKPMGLIDSILQHKVYVNKYSKLRDQGK